MPIDPKELKRLRENAGLSQKALAEKAKVSQQLIAALEKGGVSTTKHIYALAGALGVAAYELDSYIPSDEVARVPAGRMQQEQPFPPLPPPRSGEYAVPVFGIRPALESDYFDAFVSSEPVEFLTWKDGEGRIGLFAPNDALSPRIEAGDTLLLQFGRPIRKGSQVAVFDVLPPSKAAQDYSIRVALGTVVTWTDDEWVLEKSSPRNHVKLLRREWPYPLLVTGALFG